MGLSHLAVTVQTVEPDCTLAAAARLMSTCSIGALLVVEESGGTLCGILTDRDIVRQIGDGVDPTVATVKPFARVPVATASVDATRPEIAAQMKHHGVRRIPVVDDEGTVVGIVSLDDLLLEFAQELFDVAAAVRAGFQHEWTRTDANE